jgi:hypothetical protein
MIIPLIIMLTIPPIMLPVVAIEIAFNTMLIIDNITVTVQAHPIPFSSPYATINDKIPIAINTPPIALAIPPKNEGGIPEREILELVEFPLIVRFPLLKASSKAEGGSEEINAPARTTRTPPTTMVTPPMTVRIAIIVTPVGRDLGVLFNMQHR